jgi:GDSL-like lipase/acylhydrolase family protein
MRADPASAVHEVARVGKTARMSRGRWVLLLLVAAVLACAGPASAAESYVSLGDSYTAGPMIPNQVEPYGCLKSDHNYPSLAAPDLGFPEFRDASCSGAKTNHMTSEQGVDPGPNPPQFDRLAADTQLVTLGIGGNDIGFSGIAEDCFSLTPAGSPTAPGGSPCRDKYVVNGVDEVSRRIAETAPKVGSVIQGIHSRSASVRVLVVNYSAILPHTGGGCWPQLPLAEGDVPWLREKQVELNQMLADQAAANGATLVDWYGASVGHDACKLPTIRWVEPATPASPAAPVHPNLWGMQAAAQLVLTAAG